MNMQNTFSKLAHNRFQRRNKTKNYCMIHKNCLS